MRRLNPRGCVFVSVGSRGCQPEYVRRVVVDIRAAGFDPFVCLLDAEEIVNAIELEGLAKEQAAQRVAARCREFGAMVDGAATVHQSSEYEGAKQYQEYLSLLEAAFQSSASFARMCRNQVYRNLHPRLRSRGARNSRDPLTARLVPYLLKEMAVKAAFFRDHEIDVEYSPWPEMEVERALREGRYPDLSNIPKREVRKVQFQSPDLGLNLSGVCGHIASCEFFLGPIDLQVAEGTRVGIVGPSGAGKSTLLRIIGGHMAASGGRVFVRGEDVTDLSAGERRTLTVFQEGLLFPHMTIRENVGFGLRQLSLSRRERSARVDEYLQLLEIDDRSNHRPGEVSGGERQRAAIARALVLEPSVLLLDEPTAALDERQKQIFARLIGDAFEQHRATAMVVVTHDLDFAAQVCDQLAFLKGGRHVGGGNVQDVYARPPSAEVADLLGIFNIVPGRMGDEGVFRASGEWLAIKVADSLRGNNTDCALVLPYDSFVMVAEEDDNGSMVHGRVDAVEFRGRFVRIALSVRSSGVRLYWDTPTKKEAKQKETALPRAGDNVILKVAEGRGHLVSFGLLGESGHWPGVPES